jgi:hypothetical protein
MSFGFFISEIRSLLRMSHLKVVSLKSATLAEDIIDALLLDGFFLLVDHGVDVDEIMRFAKHFFADEKGKKSIPMKHFRGYSELGAEVTRYDDGKVVCFIVFLLCFCFLIVFLFFNCVCFVSESVIGTKDTVEQKLFRLNFVCFILFFRLSS